MLTEYNLVTPLAEKDVDFYFATLDKKREYLDVKKFIVIGNEKVLEKIKEHNTPDIVFENENQFINYNQVKDMIAFFSNHDKKSIRRTGWYLQQFLKISYASVCEDEYYMLWDADTIPIHKYQFSDNGKLFFDMKTEHHKPYFDSFSRLFPAYKKRNRLSYISEHMVIKTSVMNDLVNELSESNVPGNSWQEKIINSINPKDLGYSGFSEYETYGLFCLNKYPDLYSDREWNSLRPASRYFEFSRMRECDYEWLCKDYDALSFEASCSPITKMRLMINGMIYRSKFVQKSFSCKKLLKALRQYTI